MINIKIIITSLLVLIGTYSLFGQKPTEEDPNVMWTYQAFFHSYPSVHPNGNILIRSDYDVLEINGLTGELIRKIYVPTPGELGDMIEISQDGTRFLVRGCFVDYESGEVLRTDMPRLQVTFYHPNNDKFLYIDSSYMVSIFDLKNSEKKSIKLPYTLTKIEISDDGRFLAVACKDYFADINDRHTHFYLYDAKTMQLIKELEDVPAEGGEIQFIQFSENAKFVGYGNFSAQPNGTYFSCEPPYKQNKFPFLVNGIGFVGDEYAFTSYGGIDSQGLNYYVGFLWDVKNDKWIYKTNDYFSYLPIHNKTMNNLILFGPKAGMLSALDFNKILNSVSVDEQNEANTTYTAEYSKGILSIIGYESTSDGINISINDMQGNVVFTKIIQQTIGNKRIEVPIVQPSGVYILQIQDGKQIYSQKFLVVE